MINLEFPPGPAAHFAHNTERPIYVERLSDRRYLVTDGPLLALTDVSDLADMLALRPKAAWRASRLSIEEAMIEPGPVIIGGWGSKLDGIAWMWAYVSSIGRISYINVGQSIVLAPSLAVITDGDEPMVAWGNYGGLMNIGLKPNSIARIARFTRYDYDIRAWTNEAVTLISNEDGTALITALSITDSALDTFVQHANQVVDVIAKERTK